MSRRKRKSSGKRRYEKLTPRQKKLAQKFIRQTMRERNGYSEKQAIAIGLAKARRASNESVVEKLSKKYR